MWDLKECETILSHPRSDLLHGIGLSLEFHLVLSRSVSDNNRLANSRNKTGEDSPNRRDRTVAVGLGRHSII